MPYYYLYVIIKCMIETNYWYRTGAISEEDCAKIIELGLSQISTPGFTGGDSGSKATNNSDISSKSLTVEEMKKSGIDHQNAYLRDSQISWLREEWIFKLLKPIIDDANYESGWQFDWNEFEHSQFTRYGLNQFYGWHNDSNGCHKSKYRYFFPGVEDSSIKKREDGSLPNKWTDDIWKVGLVRKLSLTVNLNDGNEYEGGNLMFDLGPHREDRYHEVTQIRKKGTVIVFPSHLYHCVKPVTSGIRYSLVNWMLGKPFK